MKKKKAPVKKAPPEPVKKIVSPYTKEWILRKGVPIASSYGGNITLRALHYQLVGIGMTNDVQHYKKVVSAMIDARWEGLIGFDAFLDYERETIGSTEYEMTDPDTASVFAKEQIKNWAESYTKNRWENQDNYPEVFIEKKALIGMFEGPCSAWNVALNPCKGYPSLTFLNDASRRFKKADRAGKHPIILYFGDYDPSGEDIPRSIEENLGKLGVDVEVRRIALMHDQVVKWKLPPAPTKITDTRSAAWDGIGQVELDAVDPKRLGKLIEDALTAVFDQDLYTDLLAEQDTEETEFKRILKRDFKKLLD